MMQIFIVGLPFSYDANFHELEEIAKLALLEIEADAP